MKQNPVKTLSGRLGRGWIASIPILVCAVAETATVDRDRQFELGIYLLIRGLNAKLGNHD